MVRTAMRMALVSLALTACSGSNDEELDSEDGSDGIADGGDGTAADGSGDGEPSPTDVDVSGARLRVRRATSGDGLSERDAIVDLAFDTTCDMLLAGDGALRCVPGIFNGNVRYLDAACTQPVLYEFVANCGDVPAVVRAPARDSCPQRFDVYRVGANMELPTELFDNSTGTCTSLTPSGGTASALEVVAPTELVAIELETEERDARVRVQFHAGEDGSRFLYGYFDAELDQACAVQAIGDGHRCVASTDGYVNPGAFADVTCSTPTVNTFGCSTVGRYVIDRTLDASLCQVETIYEVGEAVTTEYYMGAECTASTTPVEGAYARGPAVQPSVFAEVTEVEQGGDRIVSRKLVVEGLPALPENSALYDKELGLTCSPRIAADGKLRCLPGASGVLLFSDEACTMPLLALPSAPACLDTPKQVTVEARDASGCAGERASVVTLGAAIDAPSFAYQKSGDACTLLSGSFGAWFAVAAEPEASAYVEIARTVD